MRIEVSTFLPNDARNIRTKVFVDEQGFTEEFDNQDATSIHLVGYKNDIAVATCRIINQQNDNYLIGRIAVQKDYRKNGFGSLIVAEAEKIIRTRGGKRIYIHAQEQAKNFYLKIGYSDTGNRDFEEGCPHCMLIKNL